MGYYSRDMERNEMRVKLNIGQKVEILEENISEYKV